MNERIDFVLKDTLQEIGLSMNKLSVMSKVRPATIGAWCSGSAKEINVLTLQMILDALNQFAQEHQIDRIFDIEDVIRYRTVETL